MMGIQHWGAFGGFQNQTAFNAAFVDNYAKAVTGIAPSYLIKEQIFHEIGKITLTTCDNIDMLMC
jgi:hypothetical protein